jgi:unsaturated rhamnogalacturonyl hydrolase
MQYLIKSISIILLTIILFSCNQKTKETVVKPGKASIIENMNKANDYFMAKFPDPGVDLVQPPKGIVWKSNIWTWGTYATGAIALLNTTEDAKVLNYLTEWGNAHQWKVETVEMFNDHLAGQTYIELYQLNPAKNAHYITDVKKSIDLFINTGDIEGRVFGDNWNWVDASYMAMPLFAQLGALTADSAYYDKMHQLYSNMKNEVGGGLYNVEDSLWWRDASFKTPYCEPNGEDCYWSRGNGWVIGALVRTLQFLPQDAPNRAEYNKILKEMCETLVQLRRTDGLWNVSLHDPTNFGGKELTGSALFLYGMAWGVNNGLLEAEKFEPVIYKAWNTMVSECMHPTGFLGFVQGTGEQPSSGQPVTFSSMPDFEDYGLGCFLLAGSEIYKMK